MQHASREKETIELSGRRVRGLLDSWGEGVEKWDLKKTELKALILVHRADNSSFICKANPASMGLRKSC